MKTQIPKRSTECSQGAHAFKENEPVISHLYKAKEGEWIRKDYCELCLQKLNAEKPYCSWQAPFTAKEKRAETTPLLLLFRQMVQNPEPKELFFLAEILIRQRQLLRRSRSKKEMVVEDAASGELYWLERCDLTLGEVRALSMKYVPAVQESINS